MAKVLSVFRLETLKLSIGLSHTIGPGIATKCPLILTDMVRLSQCIVVSDCSVYQHCALLTPKCP